MSNNRNVRSWERLDMYLHKGRQFGYPECCINQFLTLSGKDWWFNELTHYVAYKSKGKIEDGYIPCEKCSKLPRQVLIDDVNSRRKVKKPFGG